MDSIPALFPDIKVCGPSDKVYKDECVCSFHTAESEGGLYINLRNFEAVSTDFLDYHFNRHGYGVYLHHKVFKYKLDKPGSSDTIKPKRLAIGLEGGFDPNGPDGDFRFEDTYSVLLMPKRIHIPLPNPDLPYLLNQSIEAIMSRESSESEAPTTSVWDGEQRRISKYASNLEQLPNAPKIAPLGWKCRKCDLKENLWLNLTDGTILCGRRFFDGTGGNNHAALHYDMYKYPLAVKLGTISSGSADVYSYPEDEMVIDPELDSHLAHFGIDVSKLAKTEKSMIELEIDINQKIGEWSVIQEQGKNLELVYGPSYTGLANLGNSCYINSVLQVLFSIEEFQQCYTPAEQVYRSCSSISNFNHQMAKLAYGLLSGKYSICDKAGKEQKGIKPKAFKHFVCKENPNFGSARQQDAHEFYLYLIGLIERNSSRVATTSSNEAPETDIVKDPRKCFESIIEDRIECLESHRVRYTLRDEVCLSLHVDLDLATNKNQVAEYQAQLANRITPEPEVVRPRIPLPELIDLFIKSEIVTDFYSTAVKRKTRAEKRSKIAKFPKILMLQIKKFCYDEDWVPKKMDISIEVPDLLELSHLGASGLQPSETELEDSDEQETPVETGASTNVTSAAARVVEPDSEAVSALLGMGMDINQAIEALKVTNNDLQRAIEFIFDPDSFTVPIDSAPAIQAVPAPAPSSSRPTPALSIGPPDLKAKLYQLKAFISHMGNSTSCGHYVCHIRREDRWYIFNDNKVALSENPPREFGYLYFYERVHSTHDDEIHGQAGKSV